MACMAVEAAGVALSLLLCTMAGTAIPSALLGFTATPRTIVAITDTSPFMVYGVCETIGL